MDFNIFCDLSSPKEIRVNWKKFTNKIDQGKFIHFDHIFNYYFWSIYCLHLLGILIR